MDIGKPQRIIEVKPESLPVPTPAPSEPTPAFEPAGAPVEPATPSG